jgi:hypothetical protein
MLQTNQAEKLSVEKIIDLVRVVRNDLIKDFLYRKNIELYFNEHYNKSISAIKAEFLIRDLKELLISPVDLVHYAALIKEIRENNTASMSNGHKDLFYKELEVIFDKYKY